jgi:Lrp/AsnC family leucine-responsive transcriptional regulator
MSPGQGEQRGWRLDDLDRHLITLLKQDSRRTVSEMASILDVSRTTVKDRMDRLLQQGVIKRFTIEVADQDKKPTGGISAFFHLQIRRPVCRIIFEAISGWPELVGCWSVAGGTDMTVLVTCSTDSELERLRDRLARHPEVKTLWTALNLRQWVHRADPSRDYSPSDGPDRLDGRLKDVTAQQANSYLKDLAERAVVP